MLVFYLCMLKGQVILGQFIVVSTENRWLNMLGGITMFCTSASERGPSMNYMFGHGASRQYTAQGTWQAADTALEDCETNCPVALQGQLLAFKLWLCSDFFCLVFFVNFSFRS